MKLLDKRFKPITDEEEAATQRGIASDPDARELTDEQLALMRPARQVLPAAFFDGIDEMRRRRGRPALDNPKRAISIRLDQDVLEKFKATGPGWQSRINEVLKAAKV